MHPCLKLRWFKLTISSNLVVFIDKNFSMKFFFVITNNLSADLCLLTTARVKHVPLSRPYSIYLSSWGYSSSKIFICIDFNWFIAFESIYAPVRSLRNYFTTFVSLCILEKRRVRVRADRWNPTSINDRANAFYCRKLYFLINASTKKRTPNRTANCTFITAPKKKKRHKL